MSDKSFSAQDRISTLIVAEYSLIVNLRTGVIAQGESRLNFFLALVSASGAIVAILSQREKVDVQSLLLMSALLAVFVFCVGVMTYIRVLHAHISLTIYARALNRVRRGFASLEPTLEPYLLLPIHDDVPNLGSTGFADSDILKSGAIAAILFVNTGLLAAFVWLALELLDAGVRYQVLAACVAATFCVFAHSVVWQKAMSQASEGLSVRFPSSQG